MNGLAAGTNGKHVLYNATRAQNLRFPHTEAASSSCAFGAFLASAAGLVSSDHCIHHSLMYARLPGLSLSAHEAEVCQICSSAGVVCVA